MSTHRFAARGTLFMALLGAACGPSKEPENDPFRAVSSPIVDGAEDADDAAVVGIFNDDTGAFCTGTFISANVVLIARHCAAPLANEGAAANCAELTLGDYVSSSAFRLTSDADASASGGERVVRQVLGAPPDDPHLCGHDIALLVVEEGDPSRRRPMTPRMEPPIIAGESYSAIGYGATSGSERGWGRRRRRDGLSAHGSGEACAGTGATGSEWCGQTSTCLGDSGGPALDARGMVVGVLSRAGGGCESPIYESVSAVGPWLAGQVVRAAANAKIPAPDWASAAPVSVATAHLADDSPPRRVDPSGCSTRPLGRSSAPGLAVAIGLLLARAAW